MKRDMLAETHKSILRQLRRRRRPPESLRYQRQFQFLQKENFNPIRNSVYVFAYGVNNVIFPLKKGNYSTLHAICNTLLMTERDNPYSSLALFD